MDVNVCKKGRNCKTFLYLFSTFCVLYFSTIRFKIIISFALFWTILQNSFRRKNFYSTSSTRSVFGWSCCTFTWDSKQIKCSSFQSFSSFSFPDSPMRIKSIICLIDIFIHTSKPIWWHSWGNTSNSFIAFKLKHFDRMVINCDKPNIGSDYTMNGRA